MLVEINWVKDAVDLTDPSSGTWTDESTYVEEVSGVDSVLAPGDSIIKPAAKPPATATVRLSNLDNPTAIVPVIPRFAARRTDAALFYYTGFGKFSHTPIRIWTGCMEFVPYAGWSPTTTIEYPGMDASQKSFPLTDAGHVTKGMIIKVDNELIAVTQVSGLNVVSSQRGYRGTLAVAHVATTVVYRAGGLTTEFTGAIEDLSEDPAGGTVTLSCIDRAMLFGNNKQSSAVYVNLSEAQVIASYLALVTGSATYLPLPSGQQQLDPGLFNTPFAFLYNEGIYDQCCLAASAVGGKFRMTKEGKARYENLLALYGKSSTWTYTSAEMENVKPRLDTRAIYSDVRVFFAFRYLGPYQVVFEQTRYMPIAPGGSLSITCDLSYPATGVTQPALSAPGTSSLHQADDPRDVIALAGNVDVTTSISITAIAIYGQRVDVTFLNGHATLAVEIVRFRLRGQPVLGGPQENVHVARSTVPANLPPQELSIGEGGSEKYNWYRMDEPPATAIANFIADQVKQARGRFPIRAARHSPLLEVNDLNTMTWAKPFTASPTGYVLTKAWRLSGLQTDQTLAQMDVELLESAGLYPTSVAFKVGTDQLSNGKVLI